MGEKYTRIIEVESNKHLNFNGSNMVLGDEDVAYRINEKKNGNV